MTLRERLEALAGVMCDSGHGDEFDRKCLALAAARMAQEDAARLCEAERVDAEGSGDPTDFAYNVATEHCALAIRAAAEALK